MILSNGTSWELIDVSNAIAGQTATNISFTPYGNIIATNVQTALQELDDEKLAKAGGTVTGEILIGTAGSLVFEGSTADDFETTLAVTDPTADRTITLPDVSGTVITTGDTGTVTSAMIVDGAIVNADINANAEIAVSKLADGTARQLLQTDAAGTGVEWTSDVDIPGTLDVTGAAVFDSTVTIGGSAALVASAIGSTVQAYDADTAKTDVTQTYTAGQRGEITALTDGATITPDFADSNHFSVTLGGNRTLANPTNLVAGQSGCIWITQDGTGSRTLAFGSYWDFTGGTAPTLTTAAAAVDCLVYSVQSSTRITATLITNLS
jgi:hypothetical protein